METVIPPVSKEILEEELENISFLRNTNNGQKRIFIFTAREAPNLMNELGRLREITFRDAGGGTGKAVDIDQFDTAEKPFRQLIVWDPVEKEIVGGYRYIHGRDIPCTTAGCIYSATAELFEFSDHFIRDYLPRSIELGRSFVQPEYQPTVNLKKGLYSLDNLWDGLGAMIIENPDVEFFFGKMTMYPDYDRTARDIVLYFLKKYFPDRGVLMKPKYPLQKEIPDEEIEKLFTGDDYQENYKILIHQVRNHKESIPPLVNAYMNLSPTMVTFGTSLNHEFGDVEETGIMIKIEDIYTRKKERHLTTYIKKLSQLRSPRLLRRNKH